MGTHKKEKNRVQREGKAGDGMGNVKTKGVNFYRDAGKVKVLKRLTGGTAVRNAAGDITKAAIYQSRETPNARVEPNRKWFNPTRVISQPALTAFRDAINAQAQDPTTYLLKQNKLPMSLIEEKHVNGLHKHAAKMEVASQPFAETFGPKSQRKRVKLNFSSIDDLASRNNKMAEDYVERLEQARLLSGKSGEEEDEDAKVLTTAKESVFFKGSSKRIWNELYKVIDSSDVILHVLDARDPMGTRCRSVEKYIRTEAPHKHLVFVLNKVDLIPSKVAAKWVRLLSKEYPTLAFHASINNSFGKGSLIALLRQFSSLHSDRKQISVGLVGYPNVGKSAIINTLRNKPVCKVAPIAGETKVWQYVTLMRRIYMIDCPGVCPPNQNDTDDVLLLKGSIRVENVEYPAQYVEALMTRVERRYLERTYGVKSWTDATTFLEALAREKGRLLKGGEPDCDGVAKIVLNDYIRGKIPWFTPPPVTEDDENATVKGVEGREGRLGEMSKKRKRDESRATESVAATTDDGGVELPQSEDDIDDEDGDEDDFEGFSDDDGGLDIDEEGGEDDISLAISNADDEDDAEVEDEVLAISEALAEAKKAGKGL